MDNEPIFDVFNNIDAQEWWCDLEDSLGFTLLSNTIETVVIMAETKEPLEITLCCQTLIAIELWLGLRGYASDDLPDSMKQWLARNQHLSLPIEIEFNVEKAMRTIQYDSEWQQEWKHSINYTQWLAQLDEMNQRINRCLQDSN
jgi:hypothetical protein